MTWLQFSTEIAESNIDSDKRALKIALGVFVLNLVIGLWNAFLLWNNNGEHLWWNGFGLGMTLCTLMWMQLSIWEIKQNIKYNMARLEYLRKMNDENNCKGALEQYKNATKHYEALAESLRKKQASEAVGVAS